MDKYIPERIFLWKSEMNEFLNGERKQVQIGINQDNLPGLLTYVLWKDVSQKEEQQVLPGIEDPGIPGKDFIPAEWVDACEMYGKWKIVKQEQPEVDLEKEIDNVIADYSFTKTIDSGGFKTTVLDYAKIARHFYELGLNARKEESK